MLRLLLQIVRKVSSLKVALLLLFFYLIASYLRKLRLCFRISNSESYGKTVTEKTNTKEFVYLYQYYPNSSFTNNSYKIPQLPSSPTFYHKTDLISTSEPTYDPSFDIILIHGLSGSHVWSWITPNTDLNKTKSFWPRDWLPSHLRDRLQMPSLRIRVLSLRYDHLLHLPAETICETLLQTLICSGILESSGYLAFVSVDFGGTLVKKMLCRGCQYSKKLAAKTTGVMFFATPHKEDKGINSYERMVSWVWTGKSPFDIENGKDVQRGSRLPHPRYRNMGQELSAGEFAQFVREQNTRFFEEDYLRHLLYYGVVADDENWSLARIPEVHSNSQFDNIDATGERINIIVPREVGLRHHELCRFSDTTSLRYLSVLSFLENCFLRGLLGQDQRQRMNEGLVPSAPENEDYL